MATAKNEKYGLRLTLGGAPATPHVVPGVIGTFRPDQPTPVGGPGEVDLETAKKLDADTSVPLELVALDGDVEALRADAEKAHNELRSGVVAARTEADGGEHELVRDQAASLGKKGE